MPETEIGNVAIAGDQNRKHHRRRRSESHLLPCRSKVGFCSLRLVRFVRFFCSFLSFIGFLALAELLDGIRWWSCLAELLDGIVGGVVGRFFGGVVAQAATTAAAIVV